MRKCLILVLMMCLSLTSAQAQESLELNQLATVTIAADREAPSLVFTATAGQRLNIQMVSITSGIFPVFTIYTAENEILQYVGNPFRSEALEGAAVIPVTGSYRLEVFSVDAAPGQIVLTVRDASPDTTNTPTPPDSTPITPVAPPATHPAMTPTPAQLTGCSVLPESTLPVNVREGPSVVFRAIGALQSGRQLNVIARDEPGDWYQVSLDELDGSTGWVATSVTLTIGDCDNLPVVVVRVPSRTPTPTATPTATSTPTHTPTHTPTVTDTPGPGEMGLTAAGNE